MTCKCEHWQVCDECRPVRFPKTEGKDMTKELLQQALEALIESRDDVDLCYAGVKAARLSFRQERQLGFYEAQLVKHDAAIEALKQALAQQEQCGCREGECETKKDKTCRMTIEIAERDGIPEWTPAIGIECAISSLRDDAARLRDGSYMRIQIADDLDVIANDLAKCKSLTQQEQPASVDAYVGAREDAAIWKKRALEAEELNRKFIAELNGPTYLGEPAQQEQPAQGKCKCGHVGTSITVVESFPVHSVSVDEEDPDYKEHYYGLDVDATLQIGLEICRNCKTINGFWIEDTGGAEFYADWGKPRYTHPAPTQPAQEPVAWEGAEGWEPLAWHLCAEENGEEACTELIWEGGPIPEPWGDRWLKYEHEAKQMIATVKKYAPPTQPALTQEQAEKLAHRRATTYTHRSDPKFTAYAFTPLHLMDFVGDIEAHLKGQK